jgi:hypothetical protein
MQWEIESTANMLMTMMYDGLASKIVMLNICSLKTCQEHDKMLYDWPITSIAFCTPHYQHDLDRYISYMSNWDAGCDPFQLCKWL